MTSIQDKNRTRVLKAPQSKNGCLTCKARRVKCDEARPSCSRCVHAKKRCEGYKDVPLALSSSSSSTSTSTSPGTNADQISPSLSRPQSQVTPIQATSWSLTPSPTSHLTFHPFSTSTTSPTLFDQDRLANLGCSVLFDQSCRDLASRSQIWNRFLPQLSHAVPVVNAAAAALGAIYEAHTLHGEREEGSVRMRVAGESYGRALRRVKEGVEGGALTGNGTGGCGDVSLLIACALLTCAEILRNRRAYALLHFEACARILKERRGRMITGSGTGIGAGPLGVGGEMSSSESSASSPNDTTTTGDEPWEDALSLQFMALDIQKASYVLGAPPLLATSMSKSLPSTVGLEMAMSSLDEAELLLVRLIHSSYHFTAKATEHKYTAAADVPRELIVEQGKYLGMMKTWLDGFNINFLPSGSTDSDSAAEILSLDDRSHARVLRAQCLSTIIYIATVMSAYETGYDRHAAQFEQIVQDVALILGQETHERPEQRFRLFPGVVQPLFFTAVKYRHGVWRRSAEELLRFAGQEGPWDGRKMATVARRVRDIEEERFLGGGGSGADIGRMVLPHEIAERERVHGCGIHGSEDENGPVEKISVEVSRCYDVDLMVRNWKTWKFKTNWEMREELLLVE